MRSPIELLRVALLAQCYTELASLREDITRRFEIASKPITLINRRNERTTSMSDTPDCDLLRAWHKSMITKKSALDSVEPALQRLEELERQASHAKAAAEESPKRSQAKAAAEESPKRSHGTAPIPERP